MGSDVVDLGEIDRRLSSIVGGKGANLVELRRMEGVHVPDGFCVTTDAYRRVVARAPSMGGRIERLSHLSALDSDAIRALSEEARQAVEAIAFPDDLAGAISEALARHGAKSAYAVRSSATAEDMPTASFAGQHDTYLNVTGTSAILEHVRRCWASLFTERAVTYRLQHAVRHQDAHMAVMVQRMVFPEVSGLLFTADPVTSNRKVMAIEASLGLGDALVSGRVQPDAFTVRDGDIIARSMHSTGRATHSLPQDPVIAPPQGEPSSLTDAQVVELAALGRRIEAHFGRPQDIEWCLVDGVFHVVQTRPITTLFPIPPAHDDEAHVYISVGHGQMMTDPMKPLGLSVWKLTALPPMHEAAGRLFVDVAPRLASPEGREAVIDMLGKGDPLVGDALRTLLDRSDLRFSPPRGGLTPTPLPGVVPTSIATDPAIVTRLIHDREASLATLKRDIRAKSSDELFEFILADIQELKRIVFDPESHQVVMGGMQATWWLNEHLETWLGEKNAADTLTLAAPNNVTSDMGLALLEVADAIRPHPDVVAFLEKVTDDKFLQELPTIAGGAQARDAITAFLDRYGMRCVGEIDITRPRWSEHPSALVPVILGNTKNFGPGVAAQRVEQGRREAAQKERDVLTRLRALPDGVEKAEQTKRMIDRVRTFIGFREYPKYVIVNRHFVYKQALQREAGQLVQDGVIDETEDVFWLTFEELRAAVRTRDVDRLVIQHRKEAFAWHETLTPPRVLTSDGEALTGRYRRDDVPVGALVGVGVSAGAVEGRARVIHDLQDADVEPGDILVTAGTDPSWSPLFVAIAGLVTEVGGLMTHGAVIAREYGLPAVVNVEGATLLIRDGQRIRVHGTEGYVELLD